MAADDQLTQITADNWHSFKRVLIATTGSIIVVLGLMAIFLL